MKRDEVISAVEDGSTREDMRIQGAGWIES
jgi:hypothetical protein